MSTRRAVAAIVLGVVMLLGASPVAAQPVPPAPPVTVPPAPPVLVETTTTSTPAPSENGSGFFDVTGRIGDAINGWFTELVNGAADPVFALIGDRILSTPDFTTDARVRELWFLSWGVANGVFVLLIVAAGGLGMAHESLQSRHAMKELLPRLLAGWIAANASLVVARIAIGFANSVTDVFVGEGIGFEGGGSVLKLAVTSAVAGGPPFLTLIALVTVVLGLCVVCVGIARAFTVLALVAAAPIFLIGHALPHTDGAARLWWRSLIGCLSVQVGQAVLLAAAVRVFFAAPAEGGIVNLPHNAVMDLLVVTCLLWLMLRIPSYARRLVFDTRPNAVGNAVRYQIVGRATHAAGKAAKAAMAAA